MNLKIIALSFLAASFAFAISPDEPTSKEKREVRLINEKIDRAGRLYKSKKFESSAEKLADAQKSLFELAGKADADLMKLIAPEYERLKRAHELLTKNGQELETLGELPAPIVGDAKLVSFSKEVAPIIVANCGRCHVDRNRGQFSAATFRALDQSTMIAYGIPDDSRLIEVIVDGDMPPGGSVKEEDLAILKNWIAQGAKFDGQNPDRNLKELGTVAATPNNPPNRRGPVRTGNPTGKETISFGLHVAPILIENCAQCHIDMNNPSGNFSMANFQRMLRGGDTGPLLRPGDSSVSLLINRLNANDGTVMPPSGKLPDDQIATIKKWIDEGATFDGGNDRRQEIRFVAARALADSQTHEQLTAARQKLAMKNWNLVMSKQEPTTESTDNFLVFGDIDDDRLKSVGEVAEEAVSKIRDEMRIKSEGPFIKGNSAIFVFQKRYDFGELGTMLESRPIPKEVSAHWRFTTVDAYSAILLTKNNTAENARVELTRQIASVYVSSLSPDVPKWFADGVGYWIAARCYPKDDAARSWETAAQEAISNMNNPGDFISGKMPAHQAGLVSYAFVQRLRGQGGGFKKLMGRLYDGKPFRASFIEAYGKRPEEIFGSNNQQQRRGRRQ